MSQVLDIDGLLESPLADLHALAGELGLESYRLLRKPDLAVAVLVNRGADEAEARPAVEAKYADLQRIAAEQAAADAAAEEAADAERRAAERERREERQRDQRSRPAGQRGGGRESGGRGRERQGRERQGGERQGGERQSGERQRGGDRSRQRGDRGGREERGGEGRERSGRERSGGRAEGAERESAPAEVFAVKGVFDPRQGGGGMLRAKLGGRSQGDVEVDRDEARKHRLFRGDAVTGEAQKLRRARGAGMLSSVATINGVPADQSKGERVRFDDAEAVPAAGQLAKRLFKAAPFGRGSRTLVVGPARGAASELLRKLAEQLAKEQVVTALAIVAAPPEGGAVAEGAGYDVIAGTLGSASGESAAAEPAPREQRSQDQGSQRQRSRGGRGRGGRSGGGGRGGREQKTDEFTAGLQLALERGRRIAEAGGDAAVLVDGIDLLPAARAREIFVGARNLGAHGSLTIVGSAAPGGELEAIATATAVISDGRKLKLDKKHSWSNFGR